jgi:hypothetical protein
MYVCMCVKVCVCMYICICIYMYIYIHAYTPLRRGPHAQRHLHAYTEAVRRLLFGMNLYQDIRPKIKHICLSQDEASCLVSVSHLQCAAPGWLAPSVSSSILRACSRIASHSLPLELPYTCHGRGRGHVFVDIYIYIYMYLHVYKTRVQVYTCQTSHATTDSLHSMHGEYILSITYVCMRACMRVPVASKTQHADRHVDIRADR